MNAARLALSLSLCAAALLSTALLVFRSADADEKNVPADNSYGYELLADKVDPSVATLVAPSHVVGRLQAEVIREVVRGGFDGLAACKSSGASGEVTTVFTITESGRVYDAQVADGADGAAAACISASINALRFPAHEGNVVVLYPLTY